MTSSKLDTGVSKLSVVQQPHDTRGQGWLRFNPISQAHRGG